jgi:hypothetical protein
MAFLYPFLNFLQPGDLWPVLVPFKPMLVASVLAGVLSMRPLARPSDSLLHNYFSHPILPWLGTFVAVQVISVWYSGIMSMITELMVWQVFFLYVVISLLTIRDVADLRRYVWGSMMGSACVVFFGLDLVATHSPLLAGDQYRAGAYGMYANHNDYTFVILMILPFSLMYLKVCKYRWQQLLLLILAVGCVIGTLLSYSRGGILALVLEGGLLLWCNLRGSKRIVALAALAALGTAVTVHQFAVREETQGPLYTEADAENSRYELWRAAIAIFKAHPIMGVGSNRFREYASEYSSISHDNKGKVAHDTYLEVAADNGLLGLITFGAALWLMFRSFRDLHRADANGDGLVEARVAGFISFCTILFRATLDAKVYDWSFYFLAVIAVAGAGLAAERKNLQPQQVDAGAAADAAGRNPVAIRRPSVYGQRS